MYEHLRQKPGKISSANPPVYLYKWAKVYVQVHNTYAVASYGNLVEYSHIHNNNVNMVHCTVVLFAGAISNQVHGQKQCQGLSKLGVENLGVKKSIAGLIVNVPILTL